MVSNPENLKSELIKKVNLIFLNTARKKQLNNKLSLNRKIMIKFRIKNSKKSNGRIPN